MTLMVGEVRSFICGLQHEDKHNAAGLRGLQVLAREVVHRLGRQDLDPGDLTQGLVVRLLERGQDRDGLLRLDDGQLVAGLKLRLRQMAIETSGSWTPLKTLRAHVTRVLSVHLPATPTELPVNITIPDGRITHAAVAQAVAFLVTAEPVLVEHNINGDRHRARRKRVGAISRRLAQLYLGEFTDAAMVGDDNNGKRAVHPEVQHDARVLAERLQRELPGPMRAVLLQRLQGHRLAEIAATQGVGLATAHSRLHEAQGRIQEHVRRHRLDPAVVDGALDCLAG